VNAHSIPLLWIVGEIVISMDMRKNDNASYTND